MRNNFLWHLPKYKFHRKECSPKHLASIIWKSLSIEKNLSSLVLRTIHLYSLRQNIHILVLHRNRTRRDQNTAHWSIERFLFSAHLALVSLKFCEMSKPLLCRYLVFVFWLCVKSFLFNSMSKHVRSFPHRAKDL